jgi:hypothetical protein
MERKMNSTAKTVVFWFALLLAAVFLYAVVQQRASSMQAVPRPTISTLKKVEYSIIPLGPSADDLRAVLESKGNEGWELAAPVVKNGTTTELIFKREKK